MLATPLLLIMPIISRIADDVIPALAIHGPEDFHNFVWSLRIGGAVAVAIAGWFYSISPRFGRPFLVTCICMFAQAILFDTFALSQAWQSTFAGLGRLPLLPMLLLALLAGATVSWFGWQAAPPQKHRCD